MTSGEDWAQDGLGPRVEWRAWSGETFAEAERLDRPILLSLTARWCHWCTIMDATTFEDAEIVDYLNENFIPIRVDSDRRPDVNDRYNMGGWPSTAFLTSTGDTLTGATFIAPEEMRNVMRQIHDVYAQRRDEVHRQIEQARTQADSAEPVPIVGVKPTMAVLGRVSQAIMGRFDPQYGGFDKMPKFPAPEVIDFLLYQHRITENASYLGAAETTLDRMAAGDIFDHVGGGMFRYSNGLDWTEAQTEKMLDVNATTASSYLHLYQVTGEKRHAQTAREMLAFMREAFHDAKSGAFANSVAGDDDYYELQRAERESAAAPSRDATVFTDGSSRAASAFLYASWLLDNQAYRTVALGCIEHMWKNLWSADVGAYHYFDDGAQVAGLLKDNVSLLHALLDAHQVTGQRRYLDRAFDVAEVVERRFRAENDGGYEDVASDREQLGYLRYPRNRMPDNAAMVDALITLHHLTEEKAYLDRAQATLTSFVHQYEGLGHFAASYGRAVGRLLGETIQYHVVGEVESDATTKLVQACLRGNYPNKVVRVLDPETDADTIDDLGYATSGPPAVYVCAGAACMPAISNPDEIGAAVRQLLAPPMGIERLGGPQP